MNHQLLATLLILAGILIGGWGIRNILNAIIQMTFLIANVNFRIGIKDPLERISFKFSAAYMIFTGSSPFLGLTLILIGVKHFP
jgi:hypothetical protein